MAKKGGFDRGMHLGNGMREWMSEFKGFAGQQPGFGPTLADAIAALHGKFHALHQNGGNTDPVPAPVDSTPVVDTTVPSTPVVDTTAPSTPVVDTTVPSTPPADPTVTDTTVADATPPAAPAGDQWFVANSADAGYDGADGYDTVDFSAATSAVQVDLTAGTYSGAMQGTLKSIEHVVGSAFDDTLNGDANANVIEGGKGQDFIRSFAGADTLTGGAGHDTFVFTKSDVRAADGTHQGVDTITDFSSNDTLDLSDWFGGQADPFSDPAAIDAVVKFTAVNGGTMVSALTDGVFVDVVFLAGVAPGVPSAWATDVMLSV